LLCNIKPNLGFKIIKNIRLGIILTAEVSLQIVCLTLGCAKANKASEGSGILQIIRLTLG
jgi:hypothetical protein